MSKVVARFDAINPENRTKKIAIIRQPKAQLLLLPWVID